MDSAFVSEIYASVQGEGPFSGEKQIFVRLAGCPLRCRYCDTPESLTVKGHPRLSIDNVLSEIKKLARQTKTKTVSVTGGEPLVQHLFLKNLFARLRKNKFRTYLETAGIHAKALSTLIQYVDVVSMDVKLPSAIGKSFWGEHVAFLSVGKNKIFVKVVIESKSRLDEIKKAVGLLTRFKKPPLLVLQPATPIPRQVEGPTSKQVADAYSYASSRLPQVLVIPQQHKLWGVR